jgi:methionyl-tRNA formyltransferase
VVDFGRRIPAALLELPRFGCLNLHPSLLPEYRGSAPVQRALWEGRERTGVTLFRLVERMDAGPILRARSVGVGPRETAGELLDRLADQGCELLAEALAEGPERWAFRPQDEAAVTAAPKIRAEEARLDPGFRPGPERSDPRAGPRAGRLRPVPGRPAQDPPRLPGPAPEGVPRPGAGAFAGLSGEGPLFFCGEGALRLEGVQPEGKKVQVGVEWASGRRLSPADRLE